MTAERGCRRWCGRKLTRLACDGIHGDARELELAPSGADPSLVTSRASLRPLAWRPGVVLSRLRRHGGHAVARAPSLRRPPHHALSLQCTCLCGGGGRYRLARRATLASRDSRPAKSDDQMARFLAFCIRHRSSAPTHPSGIAIIPLPCAEACIPGRDTALTPPASRGPASHLLSALYLLPLDGRRGFGVSVCLAGLLTASSAGWPARQAPLVETRRLEGSTRWQDGYGVPCSRPPARWAVPLCAPPRPPASRSRRASRASSGEEPPFRSPRL